jgi:osmotically-inducible protein OsmY
MTNDDLRRDVTAELDWDPRVDSTAIEVSAADGVVTLRGTAASLRHKRSAGDAQASDGVVTLTGTVEWHYQRQAAESRTASVPGVACIDNAITLAPATAAGAVADAIRCAFRRDAVLAAARLSAEIGPGGRAILSGTVGSWAARDRAVAAAWSAAGVVDVDDRIGVEYAP